MTSKKRRPATRKIQSPPAILGQNPRGQETTEHAAKGDTEDGQLD